MPDIDAILPASSAYLKGEDLIGCDDLVLTVNGVEIREYEDGKAVLVSFEEIEPAFRISNKINKEMMKLVMGTGETDEWIGKIVTLYGTKDSYGGKMFDVVRVRPPEPKKTGKKPAFAKKKQQHEDPPPGDEPEDMSDAIPF